MTTIELDEEVADLLAALSQKEHASASSIIKKAIMQYLNPSNMQQPESMVDIINNLPAITAFDGDPLEIQKAMRDEWD